MGTVGINFGAATSGAGFDVAATVTSILALSSAVETPWKAQLTSLQAQDTAFTSVGTTLSALSTSLGALTSFDGVLSAKQGASSNSSVLALTAASAKATAGSHNVIVTSLATTASSYSSSLASASDTLSGSLTIALGGADAKTITIDSSNNTLASLAATINNGSYGVTAGIVTDSSGARLSLVSNTGGAAGAITLGGSLSDWTTEAANGSLPANSAATPAAISFTEGQKAADAVFSVDGLPTSSASNTVSGAIPGVTFQLLSSSPGTTVQVQITNDNGSIETAAQTFVTNFNAVVAALKAQTGKDASGKAEPLAGDPTLALIQTQLSTGLLGGAASGAVKNIQQLGLSVNQDGTLSLDLSTLDSTLNSNFADVTGFFQNAGSFGQTLTTNLNTLGSTGHGAISLALAQNTSVEQGLTKNIANEETLIAAQKISLTTELNAANQILQSIPQQLLEINQIYSAVTGYNTGNG